MTIRRILCLLVKRHFFIQANKGATNKDCVLPSLNLAINFLCHTYLRVRAKESDRLNEWVELIGQYTDTDAESANWMINYWANEDNTKHIRSFLLECPTRMVRQHFCKLLENSMTSYFKHGGQTVSFSFVVTIRGLPNHSSLRPLRASTRSSSSCSPCLIKMFRITVKPVRNTFNCSPSIQRWCVASFLLCKALFKSTSIFVGHHAEPTSVPSRTFQQSARVSVRTGESYE